MSVMPYITATELALILPAGATVGSTTTPLSLSEVASINAQVSAEVDGYIAGAGFVAPIATSAPVAWAQVQRIVTAGAMAQVLRTLLPNMGGGQTTLADQYQEAYDNALKLIAEGKMVLPGAAEDPAETSRALARSFNTSHEFADAAAAAASPMIPINWEP